MWKIMYEIFPFFFLLYFSTHIFFSVWLFIHNFSWFYIDFPFFLSFFFCMLISFSLGFSISLLYFFCHFHCHPHFLSLLLKQLLAHRKRISYCPYWISHLVLFPSQILMIYGHCQFFLLWWVFRVFYY